MLLSPQPMARSTRRMERANTRAWCRTATMTSGTTKRGRVWSATGRTARGSLLPTFSDPLLSAPPQQRYSLPISKLNSSVIIGDTEGSARGWMAFPLLSSVPCPLWPAGGHSLGGVIFRARLDMSWLRSYELRDLFDEGGGVRHPAVCRAERRTRERGQRGGPLRAGLLHESPGSITVAWSPPNHRQPIVVIAQVRRASAG
jgi:hypothetical protein